MRGIRSLIIMEDGLGEADGLLPGVSDGEEVGEDEFGTALPG